jgi:hypothetical protein
MTKMLHKISVNSLSNNLYMHYNETMVLKGSDIDESEVRCTNSTSHPLCTNGSRPEISSSI